MQTAKEVFFLNFNKLHNALSLVSIIRFIFQNSTENHIIVLGLLKIGIIVIINIHFITFVKYYWLFNLLL